MYFLHSDCGLFHVINCNNLPAKIPEFNEKKQKVPTETFDIIEICYLETLPFNKT